MIDLEAVLQDQSSLIQRIKAFELLNEFGYRRMGEAMDLDLFNREH